MIRFFYWIQKFSESAILGDIISQTASANEIKTESVIDIIIATLGA